MVGIGQEDSDLETGTSDVETLWWVGSNREPTPDSYNTPTFTPSLRLLPLTNNWKGPWM